MVSLLALLVPVRELFSVRGDVSDIAQQNAELKAGIADLERRARELEDPAVLERLAREELYRVPEGWKLYVVLDPTEEEQSQADQRQREARTGTGPWYERLLGSLQWADTAEQPSGEAP